MHRLEGVDRVNGVGKITVGNFLKGCMRCSRGDI